MPTSTGEPSTAGTSAIDNYEAAVRVGQLARAVAPEVVVLAHTAMCQLDSYVYLKTSDLATLCYRIADLEARIRITLIARSSPTRQPRPAAATEAA